ncbi:MAG: hypothetical protein ABSB59_11390 [Streptosporangiaceae bacterium]|jgi:hypothetical protein
MIDLLLAAAAAVLLGAAVVAVLHWRRVQREIQMRKIEDGFAEIFDDGLRNGYHEVHIDVFDRSGSRQTTRVIKARELDDETQRRLRESGGTVRVYT